MVRHGFTHFDLDLQLMLCEGDDMVHLPSERGPTKNSPGEYWPLEAIEAAGLPTVFAKAARIAIATREVRRDG